MERDSLILSALGSGVHTTDDHTPFLPSETNTIDPPKMTSPSSKRPRSRNIPQKNLLVPSHTSEPCIVVGNRDVQNFITVCRIGLDKPGLGGREGRFGRVEEANGAVG